MSTELQTQIRIALLRRGVLFLEYIKAASEQKTRISDAVADIVILESHIKSLRMLIPKDADVTQLEEQMRQDFEESLNKAFAKVENK